MTRPYSRQPERAPTPTPTRSAQHAADHTVRLAVPNTTRGIGLQARSSSVQHGRGCRLLSWRCARCTDEIRLDAAVHERATPKLDEEQSPQVIERLTRISPARDQLAQGPDLVGIEEPALSQCLRRQQLITQLLHDAVQPLVTLDANQIFRAFGELRR